MITLLGRLIRLRATTCIPCIDTADVGHHDDGSNRALCLPFNNKAVDRAACMTHPELYNYTSDLFHDHAMAWLRGQQHGGKPFFLYIAFTVPHAGGWGTVAEQGQPVPSDMQYVGDAVTAWPLVERDHAAVVTYTDKKVGELMDTLAELRVEDQTLVIFASDNGAHAEGGHWHGFFNSTGGLSGYKRSLYEGGVRSPTIARWPGAIQPSVSTFQWAFWDVMPTFAELAGISQPKGLDGRSIVPTLMGRQQPAHPFLYWTWANAGVELKLPSGWRAEENAEGTLNYVHDASGTIQAHHPLEAPSPRGSPAPAPAPSASSHIAAMRERLGIGGFAVVSGMWKGIVPRCTGPAPSAADLQRMYVYHLTHSAEPETESLHTTTTGQREAERLLDLVVRAELTCQCFQC